MNKQKNDNLIKEHNNKRKIKSHLWVCSIVFATFLLLLSVLGFTLAWFEPSDGVEQSVSVYDVGAEVLYSDGALGVAEEPAEIPDFISKSDLADTHLYVHNTRDSSSAVRVKLFYETRLDGVLVPDTTYTVIVDSDWDYNLSTGYYDYNGVLRSGETVDFVTSLTESSQKSVDTKIVALVECVQPDRKDDFFGN